MRGTEILACLAVIQGEADSLALTHIDITDPKTREALKAVRAERKRPPRDVQEVEDRKRTGYFF